MLVSTILQSSWARFSGIIAVLICALPGVMTATGAFILSAGEGRINIYGGSASASNYYDIDGNLRLFDSVQTRFSALTFGLSADYGLGSGLELNVELPIGYYQISSRTRFPERSIFSPVYYGAGATWQMTSEKLHSSISTMVKVPPGFHRGIYDDPNHPSFLSDGYLQWTTSLNIGFTYKDVWVKGGAAYNWRDEEPVDEIHYNAEVGLTRVEGTGIFVGAGGVIPMGDVTQPLRTFYAGASGDVRERRRRDGGTGRFSTIDRESYFALSAGAFVDLTSAISLNGRYILRLFGANTLALQGGYLGLGYKF